MVDDSGRRLYAACGTLLAVVMLRCVNGPKASPNVVISTVGSRTALLHLIVLCPLSARRAHAVTVRHQDAPAPVAWVRGSAHRSPHTRGVPLTPLVPVIGCAHRRLSHWVHVHPYGRIDQRPSSLRHPLRLRHHLGRIGWRSQPDPWAGERERLAELAPLALEALRRAPAPSRCPDRAPALKAVPHRHRDV